MRSIVLLALALLFPVGALAETVEIKMLNRNDTGAMVYEPDFLHLSPGDTVVFRATSKSHNAASIDGMWPDGVAPFKGNINEEVEITLTKDGVYGIKCSPHYAMGMVMLIEVGNARANADNLPADLPGRTRQRFTEILARQGR